LNVIREVGAIRTHAKNKAPLFAAVPFWRYTLRKGQFENSILVPDFLYLPKMVASDEALEAGAGHWIPVVLSKLNLIFVAL
jgi:hypothetical protein